MRHPNRRSSDRHGPAPSDDTGAIDGPGVDPGLLSGTTDDEILQSYVDLIRTWRGARRRDPLRLRHADVAVLVSILGTDDAEIERRLIRATACTPRAARYGRLLLFASVGVLSFQLTGAPVADALLPLPGAVPAQAAQVVEMAPDQAVGTGAGMPVIETATTTPTTVTATTTAAAVTAALPADAANVATGAPASPATPAEAAPPTTSVPAGADAGVSIPSLGIELPVIGGGQDVIDEGVVAHYMADGWEPPVAAGAVGTYWLAAHNSTHGSPFADLPDIAVGAEVRVTSGQRTFVYTVTSKEVVGLFPGDAAVYGTDPDASVILLQTCSGSTRRVLVHGVLTSTE